MTSTSLIISNISIHQDVIGRYSLNDLHKAAGNEERHSPNKWLRLDQTSELIEEILNDQICPIKNASAKPVDTKKGRYGGTYVCKELVYAYAMWVSAKFHLAVIRAYDDLVNGRTEHPVCKKKSLPGKITADQQEAIKQLVLTRGKNVPQEHQAKATITLWSALKSHFGCTYKEISEDQFTEALSLAARVPLEGEFIPAHDGQWHSGGNCLLVRFKDGVVSCSENVPENSIVTTPEHMIARLERNGWLVIHKDDLRNMTVQQLVTIQ